MPVNFGSLPIGGAYLGTVPVDRVMLGNNEIWSSAAYPVSGSGQGTIPELGSISIGTHTMKKKGLFRLSGSGTFQTGALQSFTATISGRTVSEGAGLEYTPGPHYIFFQSTQSMNRGDEVRFSLSNFSQTSASGSWTIEELGNYALVNASPDHWFPLKFNDKPYLNRGTKTTELAFETTTKFSDRTNHAYVTRGSKSRLNLQESWSSGWTMCGWFERTGAPPAGGDVLFSRGSPTIGREVRLTSEPNGTDLRLLVNSGSATSMTGLIPESLTQNQWKHVAIVSEIIGGRPRFIVYVNGVAVYQIDAPNNFSFNLDEWVSFGNYSDSNPENSAPFEGNLDDIALWSRPLSSNEVLLIFQNGRIST